MTLAHERSGRGDPLVVVHGFTSNRHIWRPVLPLLEPEREVIRLDLPGFGETPPLPRGDEPSPQRLAEVVAEFIDELGVERPHVAGFSMGGWIALELAKRGLARSTCAFSPAGFWNRWERLYCKGVFLYTRAMGNAPADLAVRAYRNRRLRGPAAWQFMDHGERMPDEDALIAVRGVRDCPGFWSTWRALHSTHFTGASDVRGPVTVVWSEHDRVLLPRQADRARRALPRARHLLLPDCGHVPTYDDPRLVASAILSSA